MLTIAHRRALWLPLCAALCSCTVVHPSGWPDGTREPVTVEATPGHMYGFAPIRWDVPGQGQVRIDVHRAHVTSGFGRYQADIAFTASLDDASIRCESEPSGPDVPATRFGCWSSGSDPLAFWLAPGRPCAARDGAYLDTLTTPACWNGELTLNGERVSLHHGYEESTGAPVGYVSWLSAEGQTLLSADIVSEMQVRLYLGDGTLPADIQRRLTLLTVALSWWEHATQTG